MPNPFKKRAAADPLAARRRRRWWRKGVSRTVLLPTLALVLIVAGVWAVFFSSLLATTSVEVDGAGTVLTSHVRRVAKVPMDRPLARVDLDAIRARVENVAAVESASVSRSWPHTIKIAVVQRTPVAVVDRGDGLQFLDAYGVVFGTVGHAGDRPVIHAGATVDSEALAGAGAVAGSLPPALARKVTSIELHTVDDIELLLRNGQRVAWGSAADSDQKAQVAQVMLRKKVSFVDVSVPARPAVR